jgi:hypothetical protein
MVVIATCFAFSQLFLATSRTQPPRDEAIDIARDEVIFFFRHVKDHIPLDVKLLELSEVRRSTDDDGWIVTFTQGACRHMLFVGDDGRDVESTGVSEGCFKK